MEIDMTVRDKTAYLKTRKIGRLPITKFVDDLTVDYLVDIVLDNAIDRTSNTNNAMVFKIKQVMYNVK
jgi:hypothetical protein